MAYDAIATCEHCNGNGAEPGTPITTCSRCDGQGQLRSVSRTPFGQMVRAVVCDVCGGEGRVAETPCGVCRGRGSTAQRQRLAVDVPPGIDDGQQLRVPGEGEAGMRGGPTGDLYVLIRLREHALFKREGDDLVHVLRVSPAQAALGDEVTVPVIDGAAATVRVPPGAQNGQMVRVRGKGVPHLGSSGRGDELVYLDVVVPRSLSKDQRRLYGQLRDIEEPPSQDADAQDLFGRIKDAMGGS